MADCPLLVWMLSMNREYTLEEYDACYKIIAECVPHVQIAHDPQNADSFRQVMTHMLPLLMMRHRRIPRAKWRDCVTQNGKHWIEQSPDEMSPEKFLQSMIGYHLAYDASLCGMAMTQGTQRHVVNIGLGIKIVAVDPRGVSVPAYVESMAHKLTAKELASLSLESGDEVALRRLCILLSLKAAYIKAIGQPDGFDWARLEFDIAQRAASGDGHPLLGWEFRIFRANLGVARKDQLREEHYQCVCAFFRGTKESTFVWHESIADLENWVQFINIDQMLRVVPKLMA
ncbi:hypothetical protein MIND_00976500 [Mycena indigotica]|uniref:holo-[acyl-carrier-protein] synthase n=1 Tax=Mycena indigotica TaxID=2126181 RepID=A0A8H6W2Y6_9AGAR|nr:uncharacterized protein MIND_00976500 [Mycena indigotica]KAF7297429.1 hypothetical protein MIND_00976500 [Mycena indigotica]